MKITEVTAVFPPYFGGMGNACLRYSEELIKLGFEVEVYTSNYPKIPFKYTKGLKVHRLPYQFRYGNAPLMLGLFKIKNTDIIHLHYPFYFGAEIVYLVSKIRRIPYVVTYHMDMVGSGFLKYIFLLHKKLLLKRILSGSSRIYVSSMDYAKHSDLQNIPSIQDKIVEVPLGVDIKKFKPTKVRADLQAKLGIKPGNQVILFIGQLDRPHYFKGLPVLLKAFAALDRKNVKLLIVGDGGMRPDYEAQVKKLGIKQAVTFAGAIDNDQLSGYIALGDFLVLPSIDKTESFGMVLLEAQAAGRGVVASDVPGVRAVVNKGKDGLLVKSRDQQALEQTIAHLLDNRSLVRQFGKNGRLKAEKHYSWKKVTVSLSQDLKKLYQDKAPRR